MDKITTQITETINRINWHDIAKSMNAKGYACCKGLLDKQTCRQLAADYNDESLYRKTISMERYCFGAGSYKYFRYPSPY